MVNIGSYKIINGAPMAYSLTILVILSIIVSSACMITVSESYGSSRAGAGLSEIYVQSHSRGPKSAAFTDKYSDTPLDYNKDNLIEHLRIDVELNVTEQGMYTVSANLVDGTDTTMCSASKGSTLDKGIRTIGLLFDGVSIFEKGFNGSYSLSDLCLRDEAGTLIDSRAKPYTTRHYNFTEFQGPAVVIFGTGINDYDIVDYGLDNNGNSLFEAVVIKLNLNVSIGGFYEVTGDAYVQRDENTGDEALVTKVTETIYAPFGGIKTVELIVGADTLIEKMCDGKIALKNIRVSDEAHRSTDWRALSYVTASSYHYTQFEIGASKFTDKFYEHFSDADFDGTPDGLTIDIELIVNRSDTYMLEGHLLDENGNHIAYASAMKELTAHGLSTMLLTFEGGALYSTALTDTAFELRDLRLYDTLGNTIISLEYAYTTRPYNYTDFQAPSIKPMAITKDYGLDTDKDNVFESLAIELTLESNSAGTYTILSYLEGSNDDYITQSKNDFDLTTGTQTVILHFNAAPIYEHGVDGPYTVTIIEVYDVDDTNSADGVLIVSKQFDYQTKSYKYTEFEPGESQKPGDAVKPDLTISATDISLSGAGDTKSTYTVTITATVHNKGSGDALFVTVKFYKGDPNDPSGGNPIEIGSKSIGHIKAQGSDSVLITWDAPVNSDIYVWVDPDNSIAEPDETNNIAYKNLDLSDLVADKGKDAGAEVLGSRTVIVSIVIILVVIVVLVFIVRRKLLK